MNRLECCLTVIVVALAPAVAGAQQGYFLRDLGAGGPFDAVTANAINAAGHVSGYGVINATGEIHAFIEHDGTFDDLGLLGYQASDGIAINGSDQLAVDGIGPGSTALFYAKGVARPLGSVDGGTSSAYGINSHGDIVGSARNGDGNLVGFAWIGGVFNDLTPLGVLRASAINDSGQYVGSTAYYWGYGGYLHGSLHGCLFAHGVLTDLGSLAGDPRTNTEALGIDAAGRVVGYSTAGDGLLHAFEYAGGAMQDLGTLGGANATAIAINAQGTVIGNLTTAFGAAVGAFVWQNGAMQDLGTLVVNSGAGWSGLSLTGINDTGTLVGNGTLNGSVHGFVAVPATSAGVEGGGFDLASGISGASPNPFGAATSIAISLSARAANGGVRLDVYDTTGRRVARLLDRRMTPGRHTVDWSGRSDSGAALGSGVYFARLTTLDASVGRRIVLER